MSGIERIGIEIVAAVFLIWGTVLYLEHRGAAACVKADTVAQAKQEGRNEAQTTEDAQTLTEEGKAHAAALTAPADPTPAVICVRQYTLARSALLPASAAEPGGHGGPKLPAANQRPPEPVADIGQSLAKVGQACDATTKELQAYIRDICRPK